MKLLHLLLIMCYLGWLLLISGCTPTPETAATAPATRAASVATTPAPVTSPIPDTPLLPPSSTPISTPLPTLSQAELGATYTAQAAAYTPPPTPRPTSTLTPTPTFTPIPGPVWPILFAGGPCVAGYSICDQDAVHEWGWFQIYSDGSGLRPVPQLNIHPEFQIQSIRFSPDETKTAYWTWSEQGYRLFLADLDNNNPLELVTTPFERSALLGGFDFMPETDCLVLYWRFDINQSREVEKVSVEQVCPDRMEPQVLDIIEFPDLWPRFAHRYLLSPQGDALLVAGLDRDYNTYLYIQELGVPTPPLLLFSSEDELVRISPVRWHPAGQSIEFILNSYDSQAYDKATITHYVISRDGQNVETFLILQDAPFGLCCGWSPDGREIVITLGNRPPEETGIYVFNLEDATWRQILQGFYDVRPPIWSPELP